MTRVSAWLMVVLLFGAFLSVVGYALWQRAEAGKGMPAFSVYSEERDGLAGAARLLRQLGWEPVALTRPLHNVRYPGLLILVEPSSTSLLPQRSSELSEDEAKALLRGWNREIPCSIAIVTIRVCTRPWRFRW